MARQIYDTINKMHFGNILALYVIMIISFGTVFFLLSLTPNHGITTQSQKITIDIIGYLDSLYFSFVTSTSLGYGDIMPLGFSRVLSIIEVIVSLIIFGILISKIMYKGQDRILDQLYQASMQSTFTRIISGLYNFRAEIDRISNSNLKKDGELVQNISSNIDLLSSYISDSEKLIAENFKSDILLENIHDSLSKLDELFAKLRKKGIVIKSNSLQSIFNTIEKICAECSNFKNLKEILQEVRRHEDHLKKIG